MSNSLSGPLPDPAADAGWPEPPPRKGFFTDTSVCIGCKACEVACKEWNGVPQDGLDLLGSSYDNSFALGASTWRHVKFIEQARPAAVSLGMPGRRPPGGGEAGGPVTEFRWLMESDVCKHCTHAACLDVCPTGALMRTEFGTVVVQDDICNGCGYCVPACPFGVIDRRIGDKNTPNVGIAQKCTLCYDRLQDGLEPACAKSCPTQSIQFGDLDELRERAAARLGSLHDAGITEARLYGESPQDGVGGSGAKFLLLDEPEV
jgi:formate dehydrogenase iron-sulfur subunit